MHEVPLITMHDVPFIIAFLLSCFVILIIRIFLIKRSISKFLYYICFLICVPIGLIGLGGLLNEYYERLDKFIFLEENNQLEHAKKNLQNYDVMFQCDLEQFKNSIEFSDYLKAFDRNLRILGCISLGWLCAVLCEIFVAFTRWFSTIFRKIKKGSTTRMKQRWLN